ncbi:MAG: DUF1569 domain-containing protein [Planctomycetota bacterium]
MPVKTKQAERRVLHFSDLEEILADAEQVTAGPHVTTGNWTAAQIIRHVAMGFEMANHGIDLPIPLPIRLAGRTMRFFGLHTKPVRPGIKPPAKIAAAFEPPPETTLEAALTRLREEVGYAQQHPMRHASPLFGKLTPEEWKQFQCRHAEMHFGFIHPGEEVDPPSPER